MRIVFLVQVHHIHTIQTMYPLSMALNAAAAAVLLLLLHKLEHKSFGNLLVCAAVRVNFHATRTVNNESEKEENKNASTCSVKRKRSLLFSHPTVDKIVYDVGAWC